MTPCKLGPREMFLKEAWCTLEGDGETWEFFRTIPHGSILVKHDDTWWIIHAGDLTREAIDSIKAKGGP